MRATITPTPRSHKASYTRLTFPQSPFFPSFLPFSRVFLLHSSDLFQSPPSTIVFPLSAEAVIGENKSLYLPRHNWLNVKIANMYTSKSCDTRQPQVKEGQVVSAHTTLTSAQSQVCASLNFPSAPHACMCASMDLPGLVLVLLALLDPLALAHALGLVHLVVGLRGLGAVGRERRGRGGVRAADRHLCACVFSCVCVCVSCVCTCVFHVSTNLPRASYSSCQSYLHYTYRFIHVPACWRRGRS